MGRHTDPDTLALIKRLARKGESLGFWVKDEYVWIKGESFVDLVWKVSEDKPPLITFEVETRQNTGVFSNTLKIWGPPTSDMLRPWHHFMIIHKSNLTEGTKRSLSAILSQNNIHLYESTFGDETKINEIETKLDSLLFEARDFVKRQFESEPLGKSLPELVDMIDEVLKSYPLINPRISIEIKVDEPDVDSYDDWVEFKIRDTVKRGDPLLLDKMKEARDKRMPLVIENPDLTVTDDKQGIFDDVIKFEKIIIGYKNALPPIYLTTPSKSASLDGLIFAVIRNDERVFCISTEDRNPPYFFEFCLEKGKKGGKFKISLDTNVASKEQEQALNVLIANAVKEEKLMIMNALNNEVFMSFSLVSVKEY